MTTYMCSCAHHNSLSAYQNEQDRQCKYNVTLWRICVTTVAMEMQQWILFVLLSYTDRCHEITVAFP
jgi:hypothetical protein